MMEEDELELFEHFRFDVDRGQEPVRIDKFLSLHMAQTSRHRIQLAIDAGYVRVADRVVKVRSGKIASIKRNLHPLHAEELVW